jgi:hypothetical protein
MKFQTENIWQRIRLGTGFLAVIFLVTAACAQGATDHLVRENCDVHHGPCSQKLLGTEVLLDISPKPVKAMADLKFTITLTGEQVASQPFIDLGMPGMKMGPNRVFLKSQGKGVYTGTGIIVRCPSGKRIWSAKVTVPGKGFVEFIFDVIY